MNRVEPITVRTQHIVVRLDEARRACALMFGSGSGLYHTISEATRRLLTLDGRLFRPRVVLLWSGTRGKEKLVGVYASRGDALQILKPWVTGPGGWNQEPLDDRWVQAGTGKTIRLECQTVEGSSLADVEVDSPPQIRVG